MLRLCLPWSEVRLVRTFFRHPFFFCKLVTNLSRPEIHPKILKAIATMHARISRIRKEDVCNFFRDLGRWYTNSARLLSSFRIILSAKYPSIHPYIHQSICTSVFLSIYPSVHPSMHLFIYLSIYLPVHPFSASDRFRSDTYILWSYLFSDFFPLGFIFANSEYFFFLFLFFLVLILLSHIVVCHLCIFDTLLQKSWLNIYIFKPFFFKEGSIISFFISHLLFFKNQFHLE